jgi:hypothetical protein
MPRIQANNVGRNTATADSIIDGLEGNHGTGMCLCPAHDDQRPSLHVTEGRNGPVFHCHAGCSQQRVIEALRARRLFGGRSGDVISLHERRQRQRDRWERQQQEEREREEREKKIGHARNLCTLALEAHGRELLEPYFAARGLTDMPPNAEYLPSKHAMVFPIIRRGEGLVGAQLTFLAEGLNEHLPGDDARRSYGAIKGGYIQLGVWDSQQPLDKLIIAEGVETALAAAQLCGGIPLTREGPFIPGTKIAAIATTGGYQHGQCRAAGGEGVHYLRRQ